MATTAQALAELLNPESLSRLETTVADLDAQQLLWASGYLAGLAAAGGATFGAASEARFGAAGTVRVAAGGGVARFDAADQAPIAAAETGAATKAWTILYATETGNSKRVAEDLAARAAAAGLVTKIADLRDYRPRQLQRESQVLIVTATHGLGDPPDGAEAFFEYWLGDKAPRVPGLCYSVLALGDSSYDDFCQSGRDIDERLKALGAQRVHPRVECDLDFESDANAWASGAIAAALARQLQADAAPGVPAQGSGDLTSRSDAQGVPGGRLVGGSETGPHARPHLVAVAPPAWSPARPFPAARLENQKITGHDSSKDVRHIELALDDARLVYQPGDSLGVVPENAPGTVAGILQLTGLAAETSVQLGDEEYPLVDALTRELEITATSRAFVRAFAQASGDAELEKLSADRSLRAWLAQRQIADVIAAHPHALSAQALVDCLRKLTPRLYSLASSPDANPGEAHLTVRVVDYHAHGRQHWGAASHFLRRAEGAVPVFVEANERFRPPAGDVPAIMIGPGTGVAPFRAFLQHRQAHGHNGRNWLFFGDRNQDADFLYQIEWLRWRKDGLLSHLDVAFSRDQAEKLYVQQRILERAREVYAWLESGASVYVCGDALRMAPDVHGALREVVSHGRACSAEDAEAYLRDLKRSGRYLRDVY